MNRGLGLHGLRMFMPKRGMTVLDVGCGTGTHLALYQRYGCNLNGLDSSPSMLEVAGNRLRGDADLRLGDAAQMPYGSGTFDLVSCMLVLHEMDPEVRPAVLGEIQRVLKADGRALLIDFHAGRPRPVKGWLTTLVIFLAEIGAGRRHFRNFRQFTSIGGLPALIAGSRLSIEREKIIGGDTFALYLLGLV